MARPKPIPEMPPILAQWLKVADLRQAIVDTLVAHEHDDAARARYTAELLRRAPSFGRKAGLPVERVEEFLRRKAQEINDQHAQHQRDELEAFDKSIRAAASSPSRLRRLAESKTRWLVNHALVALRQFAESKDALSATDARRALGALHTPPNDGAALDLEDLLSDARAWRTLKNRSNNHVFWYVVAKPMGTTADRIKPLVNRAKTG